MHALSDRPVFLFVCEENFLKCPGCLYPITLFIPHLIEYKNGIPILREEPDGGIFYLMNRFQVLTVPHRRPPGHLLPLFQGAVRYRLRYLHLSSG
jgi:hypothetical protein